MPMGIPARLRAFGVARALDCLERDPDSNLPRLMEWVDRYAGERLSPPYRDLLHRAMTDPDNNWNQLLRSLYTDVDSQVLKKIFENFMSRFARAEYLAIRMLDVLSVFFTSYSPCWLAYPKTILYFMFSVPP